jgi:hypothetical protein
MNSSKTLLIFAVIAIALISAMPSTDSVWTDEAQTYHYAKQPSFEAWRSELVSAKESETLMPVGMFVPWVAAKVLGTSEWSMRAINILWAILALVPLLLISKQLSLPWLPILFLVQPFLWFYSNEARPYTLQIAEGSWLLLSLIRYIELGERGIRWIWCFVLSGVLLCATSLLGVIPFFAALVVGIAVLVNRGIRPARAAWIPLVLAVPPLLLLGRYYLSALHRGAGASRVWPVNASNVAFAFYELLGFTGLGPGRVALRGAAAGGHGGGIMANLAPYLPAMIALFILYCVISVGYLHYLRNKKQALYLLVPSGVVVISFVGLAILAAAAHFPFWGRHLAPVFPAIVLIAAVSLSSIGFRQLAISGLAATLCLLLLASSLQLRYADRHAKDDYRGATNRAAAALSSGKRVWWFADVWASRYYGLDVTIKDPQASGLPIRPDDFSGRYQQLPPPDLIVLSKPDIYDQDSSLRAFIQRAGYHQSGHVQAFQFFEKSALSETAPALTLNAVAH